MRAALIHPGDPLIRIVEMPDDSGERNTWAHAQVGELLDYTTLTYWRGQRWGIQMISNDFFDGLPVNAVATALYAPDGRGAWQIRGPVVIFAYDEEGDTIPLPEAVLTSWAAHGLPSVEATP